jgi:hypothetical protein
LHKGQPEKLKERGIKLIAKPLGRPKAVEDHVRPGERNPIEGKIGQAKTGYGLNRIRARLANTSRSWIASIIMVLNLVKLAGEAPLCFLLGFSATIKGFIEKTLNNAKSGCLNGPRFLLFPEFFSRPYLGDKLTCTVSLGI